MSLVIAGCGGSGSASSGGIEDLPPGSILLAADLPDERGYTLYTWDASGEEVMPLLPDRRDEDDVRAFDAFPAWSPDGKSVAFLSKRDDTLGLYVLGPDNENARLITDQVRTPYGLTWTPDGKHLSFSDAGEAGQPDLFTLNLEDGTRQNLTKSAAVELAPAWSPDGSRVAFTRRKTEGALTETLAEVYTVNADGSDPRNLSNSEEHEGQPQWSPDSSRITYIRDGIGVVVVDVESGSSQVIVEDEAIGEPFLGGNVAWSPDGRQIAFMSQREGSFDIFSVDVESREVRQLTATPDRHEVLAGWFPDGAKLLLVTQPSGAPPDSEESAVWDIRTYNLDEGSAEVILPEVRYEPFIMSLPAWKPLPEDG